MLNGEWLYERLRLHLSSHGVNLPQWAHCREQGVYEETMRETLYFIATTMNAVPDPLLHWKNLLRRYGRHDASCATSAPCTCGFADIEKLL